MAAAATAICNGRARHAVDISIDTDEWSTDTFAKVCTYRTAANNDGPTMLSSVNRSTVTHISVSMRTMRVVL